MATPPTFGIWNQYLSRLVGQCASSDGAPRLDYRALQMMPSVLATRDRVSDVSQEMQQTEQLLTSDFNSLSVQDQSRALNDLYHAASELKENPVMIDNLLAEFEHEVEQGRYPIYEQALKQDRSYVEDPAFRLKFLRANMHDVKKAVNQMINFLSHKAKYFGNNKIAADITLDDLTPEELQLMLSGIYHIQDETDKNGRLIVYRFNKPIPVNLHAESMARVIYYIWFNILIPIHEVQMKGVLAIHYDLFKPGESVDGSSIALLLQLQDFSLSLPIRYSGVHFCVKQTGGNLSMKNVIVGLAAKALPKEARERSKVHYGTDLELQYKLANFFGIPLKTFPVDPNGNFRANILNAWFHKHLEKEKSRTRKEDSLHDDGSSSSDEGSASDEKKQTVASHVRSNRPTNTVIDGIWQTDVLLGRGRLVQYHPGNIHFREFLDEHREMYNNLSRSERRKSCIDFAKELASNGTRFLRQTETGLWIECSFDEVVDKVAQFYRTRRRRMKHLGEQS